MSAASFAFFSMIACPDRQRESFHCARPARKEVVLCRPARWWRRSDRAVKPKTSGGLWFGDGRNIIALAKSRRARTGRRVHRRWGGSRGDRGEGGGAEKRSATATCSRPISPRPGDGVFLLQDNLRRSAEIPGAAQARNAPREEWLSIHGGTRTRPTGKAKGNWSPRTLFRAGKGLAIGACPGQPQVEKNSTMLSGTQQDSLTDARIRRRDHRTVGDRAKSARHGNAMSGEVTGPRPGQWRATRIGGHDH